MKSDNTAEYKLQKNLATNRKKKKRKICILHALLISFTGIYPEKLL